jgi:hypothetical protein
MKRIQLRGQNIKEKKSKINVREGLRVGADHGYKPHERTSCSHGEYLYI